MVDDALIPAPSLNEGARRALDVLVVDDEKNIRSTLRVCLEGLDARVVEAASLAAAKVELARRPFDLAFVDLRLGESDGLKLIAPLLASSPLVEIVLVTAYGTVETAVEAIQLGARDVLQKPFSPAQIRALVDKVRARRALATRLGALQNELDEAGADLELESRSPRVRQLLGVLAQTASHDVSVLLRGENGTGKSMLARQLHALSPRSHAPFVLINCPTLSEELLASELFGHARGAFTGAVKDQPGRVEAASGGTLFLDEIGELPPSLQAKLLRFLQDRQFERVGETQTRTADVRIIAATNRDLEADVAAGRFRQDLLFRLNTFELVVPPLRDRREDIVPLAERFLALFCRDGSLPLHRQLTAEAREAILAYDWPGNIRELRNAMQRAAILGAARIGVELLPERVSGHTRTPQLGDAWTLDAIEREHIRRVLDRTETAEAAAKILGIDTSTLWRRRKRYESG